MRESERSSGLVHEESLSSNDRRQPEALDRVSQQHAAFRAQRRDPGAATHSQLNATGLG